MGIVPCAIAWLFRGIQEQKLRTGARFSVRVSAVEVSAETQRDLLASHASESDQSPGVFLRDDPLLGAQLQTQCELRAPTPEKAAFYLDAAIAGRTTSVNGTVECPETVSSHLLFTLHVYQYSVDKSGKGGVAGGRSRLHLMDLGTCERGKGGQGLSLSAIGNVLLAVFNGQKHLPYKDSKVTQLLRECLSSLTCHAAMVAHVSASAALYTETLSTIQLASRIHRLRRRRIRFGTSGSPGSGGSSGEESRLRAGGDSGSGSGSRSDVDPSSSEQSCDTVIYVGPVDDATDGEHPPVYLPSLSSGDNRCAMNKALKGSTGERGKPRTKDQAKTPASASASPVKTKASTSPAKTPGSPRVNRAAVSSNSQSRPSDEQWVDGPRIAKSRVAEARTLMNQRKETWVDGPGAGAGKTSTAQQSTYGYMDEHKKSMIKRWVETQSAQLDKQQGRQQQQQQPQQQPPREPQYKELTMFKTCEDDEHSPEPQIEKQSDSTPKTSDKVNSANKVEVPTENQEKPGPTLEELYSQCEQLVESLSLATQELTEPSKPEITASQEKEKAGMENGRPLSMPPNFSKNKEISIDVCMDRFDLRLHITEEEESCEEETPAHPSLAVTVLEPLANGSDVELIEVEEPDEPVPMQDSCLQVTEEDIALCLSQIENPLPEVDQDHPHHDAEEHPLRVLSTENLTVVSTFTDSLTIGADIDRPFRSVAEESSDPFWLLGMPGTHVEDRFEQRTGSLTKPACHPVDQFLRLHDLYAARPSGTRPTGPCCQSLSSLLSASKETTFTSAIPTTNDELHSFYSEPVHNPDKVCENCHQSLIKNPQRMPQLILPRNLQPDWFLDEDAKSESEILQCLQQCRSANKRLSFHYIKDNGSDSGKVGNGVPPSKLLLSSLRHPDGASNPSLDKYSQKMEIQEERVPGNGASVSDHEMEEGAEEEADTSERTDMTTQSEPIPTSERLVTGKSDDEVMTPPQTSKTPRLSRFFGSSRKSSKHKNSTENSKTNSKSAEKKSSKSSTAKESKSSSPGRSKSRSKSPNQSASSNNTTPSVKSKMSKSDKKNKKGSGLTDTILPVFLPAATEGYDSGNDSGIIVKSKGSSMSSSKSSSKKSGRSTLGSISTLEPSPELGHSMHHRRGVPYSHPLCAGAASASGIQCESSGYESVLRDSECSSFGSSQDSDGEHGRNANTTVVALPPVPQASQPVSPKQVPEANKSLSSDLVVQYNHEDVARLERRLTEDQLRQWQQRLQRIRQLRKRQEFLKGELAAAKERLLVKPDRWSYELHVEQSMDERDPSFVEVLERETFILQKRVDACKSHIMLVTCFDCLPRRDSCLSDD